MMESEPKVPAGPCRRVLAYWRTILCLGAPLAYLPIPVLYQTKTAYCAYCVALLATYWMTEALPIPVTALLPVFLYPIFGIADTSTIAQEYLKDTIMIFVGGLMVALAFEFCELHKRIALRVMLFTGTSLTMLMMGLMITTAFLSMWMFNTATTAMMIPIILSISDEFEKGMEELFTSTNSDASGILDEKKSLKLRKTINNMRTMLLLSVAYSSNIGGTGVVTGSGTNLVALEFLGDLDPAHHGPYATLSFSTWAAFNFLPMILNIIIAWLYLRVVFLGFPVQLKFWWGAERKRKSIEEGVFNPQLEIKIKDILVKKYEDLGPLRFHEGAVGLLFLIAVILWVLHDPRFIPGWGDLFHGGPKVSISTGTLLIGVLFFMVPRNPEFYKLLGCSNNPGKKVTAEPLLEWEFVQKRFPWGVIVLLGGGYALSKGAKSSGLNEFIGQSLKALAHLPPSLIQLCVMFVIAFLTEVTSNTATATIVVPILLELSKELNIHPLYLTLPATVTCSFAFMLPVATPPNALVYSASNMKVTDMIKTGLFMNIACVLVLYFTTNFYAQLFFNFSDYSYTP